MKKRMFAVALTMALSLSLLPVGAAESGAGRVSYLPDVTGEMSDPAFWSEDDRLLMTWEEIQLQNQRNIASSGTHMRDLRTHAEVVDGRAINKSVKSSSQADVNYYLGWTYLGSDRIATQRDFDPLIANTQNRRPSTEQEVLYAVAVNRTHLRVLPSPLPIWDDPKDPDFDYQYLVGVRVNEPLVITSVSADRKYYLAKSNSCSGWVPAEDVAICADREEWLAAWDFPAEDALVVYGAKYFTEMSLTAPETSEHMLTMGTVLELVDPEDPDVLIDNRTAYQNYVVWMPVRLEDGSYDRKLTLIAESAPVSAGYLPLTGANIMMVTMETLGTTYGWGGSLNAEDCSSMMRNIYKCFGLELARNGTWQAAMPVAGVNMKDMCREDRLRVLDSLPAGSLLYFSGHEMMYLGSVDGNYYVISTVSKIRDAWGGTNVQRIRSTIINTLEITRANGMSWLNALTAANVPFWLQEEGAANGLAGRTWYHDAVAFVIKKGCMTTDADNCFRPEEIITRAQLAQALWKLAGKPAAGEGTVLSDVAAESWYAAAAAWAVDSGVLTAGEGGTFAGDGQVTRQELVQALWNYARVTGRELAAGEDTNILSYADALQVSESAVPAVQWACAEGLLVGSEQGGELLLKPGAGATRAQLAVMLQKVDALPEAEQAESGT